MPPLHNVENALYFIEKLFFRQLHNYTTVFMEKVTPLLYNFLHIVSSVFYEQIEDFTKGIGIFTDAYLTRYHIVYTVAETMNRPDFYHCFQCCGTIIVAHEIACF